MVDSINTANCDAVQAVSQRVRLRYRLLQALPTVLIPLTILNAMNSQAFQVHAEVDSQFAVSATQEFSIASTDSSENSSDRAEASTNDSESALFFIAIVLLLSVSAITVVLSQARQLSAATRRAHLLAEISSARTFDEHDVEKVFDKALEEARQILGVSRVVIYRFKPDWSGYIFTESVVPGLPQAIEYPIEDPCIPNVLLEDYKNDRIAAVSDVSSAGFHPDHLQLMSRLHIKANLVVPILNNGQLFGLLIAHHCSKTHKWRTTEIAFLRQLAVQLGVTLDRVTFLQKREAEIARSQSLRDIALEVGRAETPEAVLSQLPVSKVRQTLKCDRVIIYEFDPDYQGTIIAESVVDEYPRSLGAKIYDPCFAEKYLEKYRQGRIYAVSDIEKADLTECHLKQLRPFAVRANLVAPINQGNQLLGLLIAHQCSAPRLWENQEIAFFAQAATQVGAALDRANLLEQHRIAAEQARLLAEKQQQQKEDLQKQLVALLTEIEGAASGDLTVRAEVTTGEIGTVSDFFNSIIESLRQIVTNVKQSAFEVSSSIGENEEAIRQLADISLIQAEEITLTITSIQQMTHSIQAVANSAHQASGVAARASTTSKTGRTAMDQVVQTILSLRDVIGETAKKVKRLGESSQEINKVVALIEKISLQTNLLSINAGIEAARAGETGQGFSVVAEEIGQLATQSTIATKDIESIVTNIQTETNEVVNAMEQSTTRVVEGTQFILNAKESLGEILEVSLEIDQLVRSISEATVTQSQTFEELTNLMKEIAQMSEQSSDASRRVAHSLQQTVEVALELQTSVSAFKIE